MLYTQMINDNRLFLSIYKKSGNFACKWIAIYVRPNGLWFNRFGITAGKKIGNAVMRNRAKRIIRQAYRENETLFPIGIDIVIVARAAAVYASSDELSAYLKTKAVRIVDSIVKNYKK